MIKEIRMKVNMYGVARPVRSAAFWEFLKSLLSTSTTSAVHTHVHVGMELSTCTCKPYLINVLYGTYMYTSIT
jgi:hypothetical protein